MNRFFESQKWRKTIHKLYSFGASIVVLGALFKLEHMSIASTFLTVGLCTEAVIFFLSAFEPLPQEVDWTLVFPELAGLSDDYKISLTDSVRTLATQSQNNGQGHPLAAHALAALQPDMVKQLEKNLTQLNKTAEGLVDISTLAAATRRYSQSIETAAESAEKMAALLQQAGDPFANTDSLKNLATKYAGELDSMNRNLNALNTVYELQLRETNQQLLDSKSAFRNLNKMAADLEASVNSTAQYQNHLNALNQNLASLNKVYGNMLAAMNIQK
ncbi:MAG: gliding motility protein GldL [Bacteroidales bacterium]